MHTTNAIPNLVFFLSSELALHFQATTCASQSPNFWDLYQQFSGLMYLLFMIRGIWAINTLTGKATSGQLSKNSISATIATHDDALSEISNESSVLK